MEVKIQKDMFNITQRLKQIDKNYFVVYNKNLNKFQLHLSGQMPNSYCLTFPFESLDVRCLQYALKTKRENKDALLKQMDEHNQKLIKTQQKEILKNAQRARS